MTGLPPLGCVTPENESQLFAALSDRVLESSTVALPYIQRADRCDVVFEHGVYPAPSPSDDAVVIHEIKNGIIAAANIQTREPITVTIAPVETGEPPEYYWAGPDQIGIMLGLAPQQVGGWIDPSQPVDPAAPPTLNAPLPIDPDAADQLLDAAAMQTILPFPGPIPMLPLVMKDDWISSVTDETVATVYQSVYDVLAARVQLERRQRREILKKDVRGWTVQLYEWDEAAQIPLLKEMSLRQVYLDPMAEDIGEANYAGVDIVLDADEAKGIFPHAADKIDEVAEESNHSQPQQVDNNTQFGGPNTNTFYRPTVTLRIFWLRNQPIPMDADDAIKGGHVEAREVPMDTDAPGEPNPDAAADMLAGMHPEAGEANEDPGDGGDGVESPVGAADGVGDAAGMDVAGQGGMGGAAPMGAPVPTRTAHFLPGTDTEVTPWADGSCHPQWPTRRGIRQITYIAGVSLTDGARIDDGECPHWDIPLIVNLNIPILDTPFGEGEPFRLERLQGAYSRTVDSQVKNTEAYKAPLAIISEEMLASLPAEFQDKAYLDPGTMFIVSNEVYARLNGQFNIFQPPPAMPAGLLALTPTLRGILGESSGNVPALRGISESSDESGKALQLKQDAASGLIGFKSQQTGDAVERRARLILHSIVKEMSAEDIGKINSKYKPHVLSAIVARAKARSDWDIKVVVSSGNGAGLQAKQQNAVTQFTAGLLDREGAQDELNIDAKAVNRREMAQARRMAGVPQQQPGEGGEPNPSNNQPTKGAP